MKRIKLVGAFALAAMLAVMTAGCSGCGASTPYKKLAIGYRVVNLSARLAEDFDGALEKYLTAKHAECLKAHTAKTPEFDKCVLPAIGLSLAWTGKTAGTVTGKGVLPTLQDAQKATRLALDQAYEYIKSNEAACSKEPTPASCTGDWMTTIRKGVCPLILIVERGIKLGAFKATENATYKTVMGFLGTIGGCK